MLFYFQLSSCRTLLTVMCIHRMKCGIRNVFAVDGTSKKRILTNPVLNTCASTSTKCTPYAHNFLVLVQEGSRIFLPNSNTSISV